MALDGRITVDALFHDTDGTASLKVVSLEDSQEYTSGKVLIVTGTVGTATVTIDASATGYKDATGEDVSLSAVSRLACRATGSRVTLDRGNATAVVGYPNNNGMATSELNVEGPSYNYRLSTTAGTASYTLVLYGS